MPEAGPASGRGLARSGQPAGSKSKGQPEPAFAGSGGEVSIENKKGAGWPTGLTRGEKEQIKCMAL